MIHPCQLFYPHIHKLPSNSQITSLAYSSATLLLPLPMTRYLTTPRISRTSRTVPTFFYNTVEGQCPLIILSGVMTTYANPSLQVDLFNLDIVNGQCQNQSIPNDIQFGKQGGVLGTLGNSASHFGFPAQIWWTATAFAATALGFWISVNSELSCVIRLLLSYCFPYSQTLRLHSLYLWLLCCSHDKYSFRSCQTGI